MRGLRAFIAFAVFPALFGASAQTITPILPFTPVEATLGPAETQIYRFTLPSGAIISLNLETPESDLDAAIAIADSSGRLIGADDDRAYPADLDPVLQGVALPRTDTYTVAVSSVASSAGAYRLTLRLGYAQQSELGFGGNWEATGGRINATADRVIVYAEGMRARTYAFHELALADFYAQADVIAIAAANGWGAGIAFRRNPTTSTHYAFSINQDGLWRFTYHEGDTERIIRDWTPHPAIIAGDRTFTLGVMASGGEFDFFYDSTFIGSSSDSALSRPGGFGILAAAPSAIDGRTEVTFANWAVTTPLLVNNEPPIPDNIFVSLDATATAAGLRHQFASLNQGALQLNVPESSVQFNRGGVNRIGVGRGSSFSGFAAGGLFTLEGDTLADAGCGVALHTTGESDYLLAYFTNLGEFGLSRRSEAGFSPGAFGTRPEFAPGAHHVLVLAVNGNLLYYLDGELAGAMPLDEASAGEFGLAVVNFEPSATVCRARNFWVWALRGSA